MKLQHFGFLQTWSSLDYESLDWIIKFCSVLVQSPKWKFWLLPFAIALMMSTLLHLQKVSWKIFWTFHGILVTSYTLLFWIFGTFIYKVLLSLEWNVHLSWLFVKHLGQTENKYNFYCWLRPHKTPHSQPWLDWRLQSYRLWTQQQGETTHRASASRST